MLVSTFQTIASLTVSASTAAHQSTENHCSQKDYDDKAN
jgi:hypothetical protein